VSLIEVLMAASIFGVTLLGLFGILSAQARLAQRTQDQVYVDQILQSRMEWLRNQSWSAVAAMPAVQSFPANPVDPEAGEEYRRSLPNAQLKLTLTSLETNLKRADLVLSWTETEKRDSQKYALALGTLVTKKGVTP
jgi:Tfp pilus assembly protein PilV